jgi:RNA-directed DNA polymerase
MTRIDTVPDLAAILGTTEEHLYRLVRQREKLYKYAVVPKPNGGQREFYKPRPALKDVQRAIDQQLLTRYPINTLVYGFVKGRSIWDCARALIGCQCLLWFDIQAFFPSIKPSRVQEFFSRIASPKVAGLLTALTTIQNQLPQGPPTSPRLSNLTNASLDNRLGGLARAHNLKVARYGDDIYFGGDRWIPNLQKSVITIVKEEGYAINEEKAKKAVRFQNEPQIVLSSLIVNQQVSITTDYYDEVWAALEYVKRFGWEAAITAAVIKSPASIRGKIGHVQKASTNKGRKLLRMYELLLRP